MRDNDLRSAKLLAATMLVCTGAICTAIASLAPFSRGAELFGLLMSAVGALLLVRQWTGQGVLTHVGVPLWAAITAVARWWRGLVREARADAPSAPQNTIV